MLRSLLNHSPAIRLMSMSSLSRSFHSLSVSAMPPPKSFLRPINFTPIRNMAKATVEWKKMTKDIKVASKRKTKKYKLKNHKGAVAR